MRKLASQYSSAKLAKFRLGSYEIVYSTMGNTLHANSCATYSYLKGHEDVAFFEITIFTQDNFFHQILFIE